MKTYEVELKRESYVTITVEAESVEAAEELAWKEIENDNQHESATWLLESLGEKK